MKKPPHRQVLGRGLDALLGAQELYTHTPSDTVDQEQTFLWVDADQLHPNPKQPRVLFDEVSLDELAHSIRSKGVLQPLLVRKLEEGCYEIISGERRWRAAKLVGISHIPCRILDASDEEMMEVGLLENIQRDNLSPIEEARGYQYLIQIFDYTQEKLAHRIGKSRSHIANLLRLLHLPESVQQFIFDGSLSVGHAKIILSSKDPESFAQHVVDKGLSVRQTEHLLKKSASSAASLKDSDFPGGLDITTEVISTRISQIEQEECVRLERSLREMISASSIKIQYQESGVSVRFHFKQLEDLEQFIHHVSSPVRPE
jgi:ParB family chromosome partitioning protein